MVPPKLNFWSISHKENVDCQQEHALRNRFLRTLLCSNDVFNPGYNRKMPFRKRTSILAGVCFHYEQLFHPVQCNACGICQNSSRDEIVLPKVTDILCFSDQLHYLSGTNCFGNGTPQYSVCLYQSGSLHRLFSYHYILSILGKIFFLRNQSLQWLAIVAFEPQFL